MISSLKWIRRGVAKEFPEKYELNEEEYKRILEKTGESLAVAKEDLKKSTTVKEEVVQVQPPEKQKKMKKKKQENEDAPVDMDIDSIEAKFDLATYDEEESDIDQESLLFSGNGLSFYGSNEEDPYLAIKEDLEEEKEDLEDLRIMESDALIVASSSKDNVSYIELYVYEEKEANLYVHHDIMVPSFPLCLEWLQLHGAGNLVAVGSFEKQIEVWNLDLIDAVYPQLVLGSSDSGKLPSKKKSDGSSHEDAVMSLSWNKNHSNILASGSADCTVKLWDLDSSRCLRTFNHHQGKVQALQWNGFNSAVLATGAYDSRVCIFDTRTPASVLSFKTEADIESVKWNPKVESNFLTSDESGALKYYDTRIPEQPLFTIIAHSKSATAIDFNPASSQFLISGSTDKTVKLWDIGSTPICIESKKIDQKVFTASFSEDIPYVISVGGSKGLSVFSFAESQKLQEAIKK